MSRTTENVFGNRWKVIRELGAGGQGKVFQVEEQKKGDKHEDIAEVFRELSSPGGHKRPSYFEKFRKIVLDIIEAQKPENFRALKVLHEPKDARNPEHAKERIDREIEVMERGIHPNLLRILDKNDQFETKNWYVTPFYSKGTLADRCELYKGDVCNALKAFRPLVEAVATLHKEELVHRDIKPENIFLSKENELILGDFGLVFHNETDSRVSETFENVGSRDWMPGWAQGVRLDEVTPAFDVFSLGKVLWSMVSGQPKLQLWYHRKEQFNLERLFPNDSNVKLLNKLLDKCIVEENHQCLPYAEWLLEEINELLERIGRGGEELGDEIERPCQVCGIGKYTLLVNQDDYGMTKFGVNPTNTVSYKIFSCDHCGHVQLFAFDEEDRPAWRDN